jgi:hypothetical protein
VTLSQGGCDKEALKCWLTIFWVLELDRKATLDIMLLAQGHHCNRNSKYDFLKKAHVATTASGYIIRQHYYPVLLDNFKNSVTIMEQEFQTHSTNCMAQNAPVSKLNICSAIDQHWFSLQDRDTFYMFDPPIGHQRNSWSDNNCAYDYQINQIKRSHERS